MVALPSLEGAVAANPVAQENRFAAEALDELGRRNHVAVQPNHRSRPELEATAHQNQLEPVALLDQVQEEVVVRPSPTDIMASRHELRA